MAANSFGKLLTLTSFGESHGAGIGGVLDGFPPGIIVDKAWVNRQLQRRRTGSHTGSSARVEEDCVRFLSGLKDGQSTGAPIAFWVENQDVSDAAYPEGMFRPSHADYTYWKKYGFFDHDGGGRASARESVARVVGGALAALLLKQEGIHILAFTRQIGPVCWEGESSQAKAEAIEANRLCCPDQKLAETMENYLQEMQTTGDTTGAMVSCIVRGVPCGLGEPAYEKLQADLAQAMMGINAAKGFEYGSGMGSAARKGSELNDIWEPGFHTRNNHSGGIQGGISNGEDIYFNVAFKPVPSLQRAQPTLNEAGEGTLLPPAGKRHDCCVIPRVIPVVESMAALVIADHLLMKKAYQSFSYNKK